MSGWNNVMQSMALGVIGAGCAALGCFCHDTGSRAALLTMGTTVVGAAVRHLKDAPDPTNPAQPGNK